MIVSFFSENNFTSIIILIILVIFSLLLSEFSKKNKKNLHEEIVRKIPHIIIGVIFSLTPVFMTKKEIIISAIILFFGIWIGKYSPFFKNIFSIKRITIGMWMTPLALGIMSWIWLPEKIIPFMVGILILAFSDAVAAIAGKFFGKKKIPWTKKTFIGSTAFFLSTFLILSFFAPDLNNLWKIALISFILTFFELILIFGLDNLFLPIFASILFNLFL